MKGRKGVVWGTAATPASWAEPRNVLRHNSVVLLNFQSLASKCRLLRGWRGLETDPHGSLDMATPRWRPTTWMWAVACQWASMSGSCSGHEHWDESFGRKGKLLLVDSVLGINDPRFLCTNREGVCTSESHIQLWKWNMDFTEPSNLKLFEDLSLLCAQASAFVRVTASSTGYSASPWLGCTVGRAIPVLLACNTLASSASAPAGGPDWRRHVPKTCSGSKSVVHHPSSGSWPPPPLSATVFRIFVLIFFFLMC